MTLNALQALQAIALQQTANSTRKIKPIQTSIPIAKCIQCNSKILLSDTDSLCSRCKLQNDLPVNDLDQIDTTLSTENTRFVQYCAQVDRLQSDLGIDLQELLYRAIDLFYQSEVNN